MIIVLALLIGVIYIPLFDFCEFIPAYLYIKELMLVVVSIGNIHNPIGLLLGALYFTMPERFNC